MDWYEFFEAYEAVLIKIVLEPSLLDMFLKCLFSIGCIKEHGVMSQVDEQLP